MWSHGIVILLREAARSLGCGAKIASGYFYRLDQNIVGSAGAPGGKVFVAGAGWITFDPTNRSVGGFNLTPVAVARDIRLRSVEVRVKSRPGE